MFQIYDPKDLKDNTIATHFINAHRKVPLQKVTTDGYIKLLIAFARSLFRNFET